MPATAMTIAIIIGAAAGAAVFCALFFLLRGSFRRQNAAPAELKVNNIRIDDIWHAWRRGGLAPAAAFADEWPGQKLDAGALAAVRDGLIKTEKHILAQPQPLLALRREIMDGIDRRVLQMEALALSEDAGDALAESIGGKLDIRRGLDADALRIRLLRYYGAAKFGDRAENDWYDVYWQAAQLKRRSFHNYVRQREDEDSSRYRSVVVVGERLKQRLLDTPPGTSFPKGKARQRDRQMQ